MTNIYYGIGKRKWESFVYFIYFLKYISRCVVCLRVCEVLGWLYFTFGRRAIHFASRGIKEKRSGLTPFIGETTFSLIWVYCFRERNRIFLRFWVSRSFCFIGKRTQLLWWVCSSFCLKKNKNETTPISHDLKTRSWPSRLHKRGGGGSIFFLSCRQIEDFSLKFFCSAWRHNGARFFYFFFKKKGQMYINQRWGHFFVCSRRK